MTYMLPFMHHLLYHSFIILLTLLTLLPISHSLDSPRRQQQQQQPEQKTDSSFSLPNDQCVDKCGNFQIPFPFHINNNNNNTTISSSSSTSTTTTNTTTTYSCGSSLFDAFRLSCLNSTSLYLSIGSESYRILQFFTDGVLVDFPNTSYCRQYNDLNTFNFAGGNNKNDYFGISEDNVVGLYDCEDSSLCKSDCQKKTMMPTCDGGNSSSSSSNSITHPACCYPLSDRSNWEAGDGFSVFSQYGCRGFSSWVVLPGTGTGTGSTNNNNNNIAKRGVKLEWAVPSNSSLQGGVCTKNAYAVNATSVAFGIRCQCLDGFVGDGFSSGVGCVKSCIREGKEAYGKECDKKKHGTRKLEILAGVLTSAFSIASLIALFCLLRRPKKSCSFDLGPTNRQSTISFRKACRTRLFTYNELERATKGFEDGQKLVDASKGALYAGVLGDGSHVAVHKVQCESERELLHLLSRVEILSTVLHKNMARLLGCCIESGHTPLVVYEYPANGILEEHLHESGGSQIGLDWYKRLDIAAEMASVLAFLQYEISPPIFHHDLKSGCIFLDEDFSVKIAGFGLLDYYSENTSEGNSHLVRSDVYDFGVVLLEIIAGGKKGGVLPTMAMQKIRSGKLEEIVDPGIYYHEQPQCRREQIEIVADLATRCLLFGGGDGKLGMIDVARELGHIIKESVDGNGSKRGPALEETFSNSSLLQMISMSPDSIYVP